MLGTFLGWAAGGPSDPRLGLDMALAASSLGDEVGLVYRRIQLSWIATRLAGVKPVDDDLRYALEELLQSN